MLISAFRTVGDETTLANYLAAIQENPALAHDPAVMKETEAAEAHEEMRTRTLHLKDSAGSFCESMAEMAREMILHVAVQGG